MLKRYVRRYDENQPESRGNPMGVIVARPNVELGLVDIGWSQCSSQDHFNKDLGTQIAMGRLEKAPISISSENIAHGDNLRSIFPDSWNRRMINTLITVVKEISENPNRYAENQNV